MGAESAAWRKTWRNTYLRSPRPSHSLLVGANTPRITPSVLFGLLLTAVYWPLLTKLGSLRRPEGPLNGAEATLKDYG